MTDTTTPPAPQDDPAPRGRGRPAARVHRVRSAQPQTAARLTFTVEEAGELIGVSRGAAYRFVRDGVLRSIHPNRRWLVPATAIDEFLDGPPSPTYGRP